MERKGFFCYDLELMEIRFPCEIPFPVWLWINWEGVFLTETNSKEVLQFWKFTEISNWAVWKGSFTITVGTLLKPERKFFHSEEAEEMLLSFEKHRKLGPSKKQPTNPGAERIYHATFRGQSLREVKRKTTRLVATLRPATQRSSEASVLISEAGLGEKKDLSIRKKNSTIKSPVLPQ